MSKSSIGTEPVYDARTLGKPRMFILGLQHMFAMFGATVLVPALSGLDVATTLLFAGIGTLLFHLLTKGKVPAFLGSSFAFIGGYNAVRTIGTNADGSAIYNNDLLAYACFGVAIAGLMYIILSTLFKIFGVKKVMRYFPPIVTGPIIIAIGLTLSSSAITNCRANWLVAVVAILIVIGFNMWGKGMAKIIPILLGVLGSYIFALIVDPAERASVAAAVSSAKWFGLPIFWKNSVFHLFAGPVDSGILWSSVLTIVPLSLATMVEHIGDICAISSTCGRNYMVDPGFHRTLLGDGLATTLASLFGAPANTTYGENTGVLALSHRCLHRHRRVLLPEVRGARVCHADGHHRRRVPRALRHDLRCRRAQRRREQGRLHQHPQRHHRRAHPRARHRHHLLRQHPDRRRVPVGSGCLLHRGHPAQRHPARQGLHLRAGRSGRDLCGLQGLSPHRNQIRTGRRSAKLRRPLVFPFPMGRDC